MITIHHSVIRCLCALFLVLFGAIPLAQAQAVGMSLEDIVALKRVSSVRMSPDGQQIAYLLTVPREIYKEDDGPAWRELHVVDLEGDSRPYVSGEIDVANFAWSADGKSVFFVTKRNPDDKFNSLYEIPLAGGEAVKRFTHVNSIKAIHPAPDGKRIAFTANDAPPDKKEELDKKGFKAVVYEESVPVNRVWMLDIANWEAQAQELPGSASDFNWSADGSRYAVALAPTPLVDDSYMFRDVYVANSANGEVMNKLGSIGKLGHFEFSPDGERIAYIGSDDINDPSAGRLYVVSSAGGEPPPWEVDHAARLEEVNEE